MSKYSHLEKAGVRVGQPIETQVHTAGSDNSDFMLTDVVAAFAGGGFYGSVLLLTDTVIKTTQPDALHAFLREMNWETPFSPGTKLGATLDHISGRIINLMVGRLTQEAVKTPTAVGYTQLHPSLGHGQVLERVRGRGASFFKNSAENSKIAESRQQIWELGKRLGLEQAAQVHANNPFGKPNIWITDSGEVIWLDYLAAFKHTGKVWPFFHFPFHDEVGEAFAASKPTFNAIHLQRARAVLAGETELFSTQEVVTLSELFDQYHELQMQLREWERQDSKQLYIQEAVDKGLISNREADEMRKSPMKYRLFRLRHYAELLLQAGKDKLGSLSPVKFATNSDDRANFFKFFTDREHRDNYVLEHSILWGAKQALERGLISQEEFVEALNFVPKSELKLYVAMQVAFFINSRLLDVLSVVLAPAAYAYLNPYFATIAILSFNVFAPGAVRSLSALAVGAKTGIDMSKAAGFSFTPILGNYLFMPLQLKKAYGKEADMLAHYTVRGLVAKFSSFKAGGGWDSDLEEKIWQQLEKIWAEIEQIPGIRKILD